MALAKAVIASGDYNGDGTCGVGVFRPSGGLWVIRNLTRSYFGSPQDFPVPFDCTGNGTVDIGIFRDMTGLWAWRGVTRFYYGTGGDWPVTGAFQLENTPRSAGVFRAGAWLIRSVTRCYFGGPAVVPIAMDWTNIGYDYRMLTYNPVTGLWAERNGPRFFYGAAGDIPLTSCPNHKAPPD